MQLENFEKAKKLMGSIEYNKRTMDTINKELISVSFEPESKYAFVSIGRTNTIKQDIAVNKDIYVQMLKAQYQLLIEENEKIEAEILTL